MKIVDFKKEYIQEAENLFRLTYAEEQGFVEILPMFDNGVDLLAFADNSFSVVAIEQDKVIGVLCSYPPFNNAFGSTNVRGVFSPMGANAAIKENRAKIYAAMYQVLADKWVKAGALSHAICICAHDDKIQHEFFRLGFGLRCIDAIRVMNKIETLSMDGYEFKELSINECSKIYPLYTKMYQHHQKSPLFLNRSIDVEDDFIAFEKENHARYFVAYSQDEICAYFKIAKVGETFVSQFKEYIHICGAYCLPQYRGKGIVQNLLNHVIEVLKSDGYTMLGVDFESINPTAYNFWSKYFIPYAYSLVRRIDEMILNI